MSLFSVLVFVVLASASAGAITFNNAYIQNVKSGACVTIDKDALLSPLSASPCVCGPYQFWKMEDGDHVINELAYYPYMDELYGYAANGQTVGIYAWTGSNWQKWTINKGADGNYAFVVRQTGKCLRQNSDGKIDQWDCDGTDASQSWKIVENPCGAPPTLPTGRFQLQNPATGMCATILDNSDGWWAKVVTHKCSCTNPYHYWTINGKTMISEGASKQCFANWEAQGHPGVTQCICADDSIHRWRFNPNPDGTFSIITTVDGKCVKVPNTNENSQLGYDTCSQGDAMQKWRFYDECNPPPAPTPAPTPCPSPTPAPTPCPSPGPTPCPAPSPSPSPSPSPNPSPIVIPFNQFQFFTNGQMNWLTPDRYNLLIGGRWDPVKQIWYTVDGKEIRPSTPEWTTYFGNLQPSQLSILFPSGGGSWNSQFGWMSPNFFQQWTGWQTQQTPISYTISVPGNVPASTIQLLSTGNVNWLTPDRVRKLGGGTWTGTDYVTKDGVHVVPGTPAWTQYFGSANTAGVNTLFGGSGSSFDSKFGWMTDSLKNFTYAQFPDSFPWNNVFSGQMTKITQ